MVDKQSPSSTFTLIITQLPGQPIRVEGPLQDKNLCYMLLFQAMLAIKDYNPGKILQPIILPFDPTKAPTG